MLKWLVLLIVSFLSFLTFSSGTTYNLVRLLCLLQAEGVELMWLMLANKRQSRYGALKLLDFASTRYGAPCEKLVDLGCVRACVHA